MTPPSFQHYAIVCNDALRRPDTTHLIKFGLQVGSLVGLLFLEDVQLQLLGAWCTAMHG